MQKPKAGALVLADGSVFLGQGYGFGNQIGELVFNTALTGYQEILTDPSYSGQIIVMTCPQMGNVGVNSFDNESDKIFAKGFVVRELSQFSNWRAQDSLENFLNKHNVPILTQVDTRAITRHIRNTGVMGAVLAIGAKLNFDKLKQQAKNVASMSGQNLAQSVSANKPYTYKPKKNYPFTLWPQAKPKKKYKVAVLDFGIKENILRLLAMHGCEAYVFPYATTAQTILSHRVKFDGLFLSNGPGDPAVCEEPLLLIQNILGRLPIFGICLGHQLLALALGAKTYKLKFGHRGANQPVIDLATRKVEITSQNHGFAVAKNSLPNGVTMTHQHLNDKTVAGIACANKFVFSVQYHPEAAPGPHDSHYHFIKFVNLMEAFHAQTH